MARATDLVGIGVPPAEAALSGYTYAAVSAAGTAATDATVVKKAQNFIELTATGSDGIRLPADAEIMRPYVVANTSGSTGKVYPHTGGSINGGSTDAAESLGTTVTAMFWRMTATKWVSALGA